MDKLLLLRDVFKSLPFKLSFASFARLDLLNAHREEIDILLDMGMVGANFGVETFHDKAAKVIGKGMVGKIAKDFLHELKTVHWKGDIKIAMGLIQGIPYETYESHEETIRWILDPENLVESVQPHALSVVNPLKDIFPYKSKFQLESAKYGFYWPDSSNSGAWKNMIGPVKTHKEATELYKKAREAVVQSSRDTQGGFGVVMGAGLGQFAPDPKNLADLMAMDRFQFTEWSNTNGIPAFRRFFKLYKEKLFSL